jgi:hypothetical protein
MLLILHVSRDVPGGPVMRWASLKTLSHLRRERRALRTDLSDNSKIEKKFLQGVFRGGNFAVGLRCSAVGSEASPTWPSPCRLGLRGTWHPRGNLCAFSFWAGIRRLAQAPPSSIRDVTAHSRGTNAPELLPCPSVIRGRRESRVRDAPAASRANDNKHTSVVTTGSPQQSGFPCAMVYGLYRALPSDRACLPLSPRGRTPHHLTPASGRQDHTALPSASVSFVVRHRSVHRIPRQRS